MDPQSDSPTPSPQSVPPTAASPNSQPPDSPVGSPHDDSNDIAFKAGPIVYRKSRLVAVASVLALYLSIIPFAGLILAAATDYATGNNKWPDPSINSALFSGVIGFVACWGFILFYKPARQTVSEIFRLKRLHQIALVVCVIAIVVVPWSIWQENKSDKADRPIEANLLETFHNAEVVAGHNNLSFGATSSLVKALGNNPLVATSGVAKNKDQVSVAVGGGGSQLVLVTTDGSSCLGLVENGALPNGQVILNAVTNPGTMYANWIIPNTGCTANPLPSARADASLGAPEWSSKDFGFGSLP